MAITVQTGAPEQVAGDVRAGSHVAVFLTYGVVDKNAAKTNVERTRVLLPRLEVLAAGTYQANSDTNQSRSGSLMLTVAVDRWRPSDSSRVLVMGPFTCVYALKSVNVQAGPGVDKYDGGTGTSSLFK
jgi:pilus assembly protein CpaB